MKRKMVAVTIGVGAKWRKIAELAAESVRERTGLETRIMGDEAMTRYRLGTAHFLKFRLFEEFPDADDILYFDADTIFLQQWDPRVFAGHDELICVRDRDDDETVRKECKLIELPANMYFNSGFFIVNREHHARMLHKAEHDVPEYQTVFFDQTYLNRARRVLGIPALFLPKEYNYLGFDLNRSGGRAVIGHFHLLDRRPEPEIEPYFRGWLARSAGRCAPDPRTLGYVSRPPADTNPPVPPTLEKYRALLEAAVKVRRRYPAKRFAGRGIVICGGGAKYFPCLWVCVKMLRHLGCELPIEVWHLGPHEMTPAMRALLAPLGVRCVDGHEVRREHPVRTLHGWELKCYALLHSAFAEALLLDADNVPVADPSYLFDEPEYLAKGAVFWPDFGRLGADRSIWQITGVPYRDEPEFESGQILVNKGQCWRELHLAMHFNEHSDFYYRHVHGDKETFHLAWRKLGRDYAMPERGIYALEATMCQHDFQGRRIFQHRNFDKWKVWGGNRRIHGFKHEDLCLGFVEELRAQWNELPLGVRRWLPERRGEAERAAAQRLVAQSWDYRRLGKDRRAMRFLDDGRVGEGAAGCEQLWDIRTHQDQLVLEVFSATQKTLAATFESDGVWRGRWLAFERMPVEIAPLDTNGHAVTVQADAQERVPPGAPAVEVVLINFRRAQNLARIVAAFRAQSVPCLITVCDTAPEPDLRLPSETHAQCDRVYRWEHECGPFSRFVPAGGFDRRWTLFHDDDALPGPRYVEHLLACADGCDGGAFGQLGRRFEKGGYVPRDVPRATEPVAVDVLVRGYLVRTEALAHLFAARHRHAPLADAATGEDDLLLALALREAGLQLWITPRDADPATRFNFEELPDPHARTHRPDHQARRDTLVRQYFPQASRNDHALVLL